MSATTTVFAQVGFTTTVQPPRPAIYYTNVALYNPLLAAFGVNLGVNQNVLSPQSAQLYAVPTSGSPPILTSPPSPYPYGAYLGPVTAIWYEPGESPGSYPVSLGAISGLFTWTAPTLLTLGLGFSVLYSTLGVVPSSIVITNLSNVASSVEIYGEVSDMYLDNLAVPANGTAYYNLAAGSVDTAFYFYNGGANVIMIQAAFAFS